MFAGHNDGKYTLGFGLKLGITQMGQEMQGANSYFMRPADPHISILGNSNESYTMTIDRKYDKYFEWSDFIEYYDYANSKSAHTADQYERAWVKFNYKAMKEEGIYFPEDYSDPRQGWETQKIRLSMNFNIEIFNNGFSNQAGGHVTINTNQYKLVPGPYNAPTVIPVRAHIKQLLTDGRA
jgi:hypothetical protein